MPWIVVGLIRVVVPLLIVWFPLVGSLLGIMADNLDVVLLDAQGVTDFSLYNVVDKGLDTYMYAIQAVTMYWWVNKKARTIGWVLFAYRLVGVIIYELIQWRPLLMIFPNVFETYFIVYLMCLALFKKDFVTSTRSTVIFLLLLIIPKIYQEYLFHVVQIPLYRTLRPLLFFWQ